MPTRTVRRVRRTIAGLLVLAVLLLSGAQASMAHPRHLHGHHFPVVVLNGQPLQGAVRDTVLVPVNGTVTVAFDADSPGRWLLHCHNLFHMAIPA